MIDQPDIAPPFLPTEAGPQFRLFTQTIPNHVWAARADGMLYWISDSALDYAKQPHDALTGTGWTQIVHPDDLSLAAPMWSAAISSGEPYQTEFRLRRADGTYRWFLARALPVRNESGQISGWIGSNTDIEDQKRAFDEAAALSRRLVSAQAELQNILNSAGSAFYSVDTEGHTTLCNTEFLRLLGFEDESEVVGRKLHGQIHHTHMDGTAHLVTECPIYQCASTGREAHIRADIFFRKDGKSLPVEYWVRSINRDGEHRGAICTFNDISERVELEQQRTLLTRELEHRGKNTLSLVQAIVSQSLRNATTPAEANERIGQRLAALGHAQDLLTRRSWTGASISDIIARAILVHQDYSGRVNAVGPEVLLGAKAALSLNLAVHELCTNAVKYGALSRDDGAVDIIWHLHGEIEPQLHVEWREHGGPPVIVPTRRGFGSRLVSTSFAADAGGSAELSFEPSGVVWRATVRLRDISE